MKFKRVLATSLSLMVLASAFNIDVTADEIAVVQAVEGVESEDLTADEVVDENEIEETDIEETGTEEEIQDIDTEENAVQNEVEDAVEIDSSSISIASDGDIEESAEGDVAVVAFADGEVTITSSILGGTQLYSYIVSSANKNVNYIKLNTDLSIGDTQLNTIVNKNLTIDLNGHTLTIERLGNNKGSKYLQQASGELTITSTEGRGYVYYPGGTFFKQNKAGLTLSVSNVDFECTDAYDDIFVLQSGSNATFKNCSFTGGKGSTNESTNGAISYDLTDTDSSTETTLTVTDCDFSENRTGIALGYNNYTVEVSNSTFNGSVNGITQSGTTNTDSSLALSIEGATFTGNSNGIVLDANSTSRTVELKDSTFKNNTSTSNGAAVYINDGSSSVTNTTIENSTFSGNKSSDDGDSIYANGKSITITGSTFSDDKGTSSVVLGATENTVKDSTITDNAGTGINNTAGTLTVSGATITGNKGGGIVSAATALNIGASDNSVTTITGNTAETGAGINFTGTTLSVAEGTILCNNVATKSASDVYLGNNSSAALPDASTMNTTYQKTGVNVNGWFNDDEGNRYKDSTPNGENKVKVVEEGSPVTLSGPKSLIAASSVTITYIYTDTEGKELTDTVDVVPGKQAKAKEISDVAGSRLFQGWYTKTFSGEDDTEGTWDKKFNFDKIVTDDVTLYARWKQDYTITIETDAVDGDIDEETEETDVYVGDKIEVSVAVKGEDGTKFTNAGWTIEYNPTEFEYVKNDIEENSGITTDAEQGKNTITTKVLGTTGKDEYDVNEKIVTYTFKALSQKATTLSTFNISATYANDYDYAGVEDSAVANNGEATANIVIPEEALITVNRAVPTDENSNANAIRLNSKGLNIVYDGVERKIVGTPNVDAEVYYSTDSGKTWTDTAPTFKNVTDSKVKIRAISDEYGEYISKEIPVIITQRTPVIEIESEVNNEQAISSSVKFTVTMSNLADDNYSGAVWVNIREGNSVKSYRVNDMKLDENGTSTGTLELTNLTSGYVATAEYIEGNYDNYTSAISAPINTNGYFIEVVNNGERNNPVPDYISSLANDTSTGYIFVLVYTDDDNLLFNYNNKDETTLMYDVTAAGYMYVDDNLNTYDHIFKNIYGLVVPALEGDFDQSNYRANVEAVDNSDEEIEKNVISPYDEDINFTNLVDINDVSAGFAVYNARENYMRDLINTVIKADVNRDKMVDIDDVNLIKKAAHIK